MQYMKWNREQYIDLMTFKQFDRQMFVELFGPLIGLEKEWRAQGASIDELELTAFDFDYVPHIGCGGNFGLLGGVTPRVIEDTQEYSITIDKLGRKMKLCKHSATIPLPMDYPVKDMDSWLKIKPWFEFNEERINWDMVNDAKEAQKNGAIVSAWIQGGFDFPRQLMGEEGVCLCYYDDPELMQDMLDTIEDTALKVLDRISEKLTIDNLAVHEDMAGKSGPLIGPNLVRQHVKPYYKKVWEALSSKGTQLFSQDSDGNMNVLIEEFLDSGVNIMYPMEPAAGMDVVQLRKKYGNKLAFKGGIDKHVLRGTKEEIRKELEYKLQPIMQQGGMVFGIDHRIPNGTPLENYRFYVNTVRELLGIPALNGSKGWSRMAF